VSDTLLLTGPGPPTLPGQEWLQALGLPSAAAGGWGVAARVPLGPLADATPEAALSLVAARLRERIVSEDPFVSGVLVARLRAGAGRVALDLAPASVTESGVATSLLVQSVAFDREKLTVESAESLTATEHAVSLSGESPVRLPGATLEWPFEASAARLALRMPEAYELALQA
jgi:hypothetical protein